MPKIQRIKDHNEQDTKKRRMNNESDDIFDLSPPVHPLCCAGVRATDPMAMYTCDNRACLQRHLVKIFVNHIKLFEWTRSIEVAQDPDFAISIAKFEPFVTKELSTSRSRKTLEEGWEQVGRSKLFVMAAEEETAIFAEADKNWQTIIEKSWKKLESSQMEFSCPYHKDVIFKCWQWKPRGTL